MGMLRWNAKADAGEKVGWMARTVAGAPSVLMDCVAVNASASVSPSSPSDHSLSPLRPFDLGDRLVVPVCHREGFGKNNVIVPLRLRHRGVEGIKQVQGDDSADSARGIPYDVVELAEHTFHKSRDGQIMVLPKLPRASRSGKGGEPPRKQSFAQFVAEFGWFKWFQQGDASLSDLVSDLESELWLRAVPQIAYSATAPSQPWPLQSNQHTLRAMYTTIKSTPEALTCNQFEHFHPSLSSIVITTKRSARSPN
jgi:hypothetical protein